MKTSAVLLAMLSLAGIGRAGQTNQVDLHQAAPASQPPGPVLSTGPAPATNAAGQRLFRVESKYGGVLPELQRRKTHFFQPTPPRPGLPPGFENVSINPITGRPDGIILLSIKF